jgi:ArsR family transcriptional regulator
MSNYRNANLDQYADIFKALSNPHRLNIFMRLASCCTPGTACDADEICECVGEVSKNLGIAASTVSHHIKELSRAGLISLRRRGQNIECRVDPETLDRLTMFFKQQVPV